MDRERIINIIQCNGNSKRGLISILEEIQAECTYLPETALRLVAEETGHSIRPSASNREAGTVYPHVLERRVMSAAPRQSWKNSNNNSI